MTGLNDGVPGIGGVPPTQGTGQAKAGANDTPEFRRILEKLEQLAKAPPETPPQDAEQLQDALRKAEDGFSSAMDLRRRLEEAFRARLP
jgi:hypothetical protein